jgi:hypothetical protein
MIMKMASRAAFRGAESGGYKGIYSGSEWGADSPDGSFGGFDPWKLASGRSLGTAWAPPGGRSGLEPRTRRPTRGPLRSCVR